VAVPFDLNEFHEIQILLNLATIQAALNIADYLTVIHNVVSADGTVVHDDICFKTHQPHVKGTSCTQCNNRKYMTFTSSNCQITLNSEISRKH